MTILLTTSLGRDFYWPLAFGKSRLFSGMIKKAIKLKLAKLSSDNVAILSTTHTTASSIVSNISRTVNSHRCIMHVRCFCTSMTYPFKVLPADLCTVHKEGIKYKENLAYSAALQNHFEALDQLVKAGGGKKSIERHVDRNKKMLPIDRMKKLFDNGECMELAKFAGIGMDYGDIPRAGSFAGIGKIFGRYCIVAANDATVKAGTIYPITLKKQLRIQEISGQNRLPVIYLVDSGGAFLPLQSEIFLPGGRSFYNIAALSADKIPQIALVCGSCTAGAAYIPTMSDEAVIVHKIGTIFLGGPPLVQAATGEIVSAEDLGGATLHSSVSGCTDYFAVSEEEALQTTRDIVASLNLPPYQRVTTAIDEPLYDAGDLNGIVTANHHTLNMYQVLSRIVDGSRFHEFKKLYGSSLVTGFAHLQGHLVGLVCNNGHMTAEAAAKGAHFVSLCCERRVPLIFLQNVHPDDAVGRTTMVPDLAGNQLRDHGKMMAAVACARVPKLTVIIGASYPPVSYMMGGRCTSPNFLFTWPGATISVMKHDDLERQLKQDVIDDLCTENDVADVIDGLTETSSSFYPTSRLLDDGMILPQHTRKILGECLNIVSCYQQPADTLYPVFRM